MQNNLISLGRRFHVAKSETAVAIDGLLYKQYTWPMLDMDTRQGCVIQYTGTKARLLDDGMRQEFRTFAISRGDAFTAWRVAIEA